MKNIKVCLEIENDSASLDRGPSFIDVQGLSVSPSEILLKKHNLCDLVLQTIISISGYIYNRKINFFLIRKKNKTKNKFLCFDIKYGWYSINSGFNPLLLLPYVLLPWEALGEALFSSLFSYQKISYCVCSIVLNQCSDTFGVNKIGYNLVTQWIILKRKYLDLASLLIL